MEHFICESSHQNRNGARIKMQNGIGQVNCSNFKRASSARRRVNDITPQGFMYVIIYSESLLPFCHNIPVYWFICQNRCNCFHGRQHRYFSLRKLKNVCTIKFDREYFPPSILFNDSSVDFIDIPSDTTIFGFINIIRCLCFYSYLLHFIDQLRKYFTYRIENLNHNM